MFFQEQSGKPDEVDQWKASAGWYMAVLVLAGIVWGSKHMGAIRRRWMLIYTQCRMTRRHTLDCHSLKSKHVLLLFLASAWQSSGHWWSGGVTTRAVKGQGADSGISPGQLYRYGESASCSKLHVHCKLEIAPYRYCILEYLYGVFLHLCILSTGTDYSLRLDLNKLWLVWIKDVSFSLRC